MVLGLLTLSTCGVTVDGGGWRFSIVVVFFKARRKKKPICTIVCECAQCLVVEFDSSIGLQQ